MLLAAGACVTVAVEGCAAHAPVEASTSGLEQVERVRARASGTLVLVGAELAAAGSDLSLYDALRELRPSALQWRKRGTGDSGSVLPVVYVNGVCVGDTDALRRIRVEQARKVQLIQADDAVHRYGRGHEAGAILVTVSQPLG